MVAGTEHARKAAPKARIFISYSRKDMAFAERLEAALKARSFEPLIDRTEIFDVRRKLAAQDPGNAEAQTDLVIILYDMSTLIDPVQARALLTEALSILEKLDQEHKLTEAQEDWPDMMRTALSKLP